MIRNFYKKGFLFRKKYFCTNLYGYFKNLLYKTYPPENYIEEEFKNNIKAQKLLINKDENLKKIIDEQEKFNKKFSKEYTTSLVYISKYNKINPIKYYLHNTINKLKYNKYTKKIKSIYKKSDLYILLSDFYTSFDNLLFNIKFSNNPIISNTFNLIHKINLKSSINNALTTLNNNSKIQIYDISHLEKQVQYLFKEIIYAYYNNDIEKLKKISGKSVLALFNALNNNKTKKIPIYIDIPVIINAETLYPDNALIHFKINVLELIDNSKLENNTYYLDVMKKNDNINELGHNLYISNLQRIDNIEMLI